jgi:hypothetical protein
MRLHTKIGLIAASVVGVALLAAAAVPYVVDVDAYKPAIVNAVKEATGRELVIEGPMKLSMFPRPRISARRVHFANAVGGTGAQMVDVRWIGASPSWWALLRGSVEIDRLTLAEPVIVLESDAHGRPNWDFAPGAGASQPAGAPASGLHMAIGRLRIVRGTISYTDPRNAKTIRAEAVDLTAAVGSFEGPISMTGTATVNGVPLALDIKVSEPSPRGHEVAVKLKVESGTLDFSGRVDKIGPDAEVTGKLSIAAGRLSRFIAVILRAVGEQSIENDSSAVGRFTFDGGIEYSPRRLALSDFRMSMAGETASGTLALTPGPTPKFDGHVSLPKVDLEKWRVLLEQPGLFQPEAKTPEAKTPAVKTPAVKTPAVKTPPANTPAAKAASAKAPPVKAPVAAAPNSSAVPFDAQVSLDIAEVVYRKGTVRDLSLVLDIRDGVVAVPRARAILPGDMVLQASSSAIGDPAKPFANGELSLVGARFRETLAWLDIDISGVPEDRLQALELHGKFVSAAGKVQVSDAAIAVDGTSGTGSGVVTFGKSLVASAQIQFEQIDLDPYVPSSPEPWTLPDLAATPVAAEAVPSAVPLPSFSVKAKVAKLLYRGQPLKGVEADLVVQGNHLKLNVVKVADLLGAKFSLSGSVNDFGTVPRFDLMFSTTMPDADRVFDYAGLPKFMNGKIGNAAATGHATGTMAALAVRDATVTMLGITARAAGSVVLGSDFRFDLGRFSLQTDDVSRLVSVATGSPQSGLGAVSATGTFKGTSSRAAFNGELTALGSAMTGTIDTTLGARPNITATLQVPGTIDIDQWLGVAASPVPATVSRVVPGTALPVVAPPLPGGAPRTSTAKPIDLSGFRAFDASLALFTQSIVVSSLRVNYGDLTATLRNGVLKVSKLTGQFFGGAVDFTGTVDASKARLAVDLSGSLQGIHFGEMLQGAGGTNAFGNSDLMVAIDGKMSVMEIGLEGSGNSLEEIRDSLVGRGQVEGTLRPAVVKGSLGLASFAADVGGIFSTQMAFGSAVLQGFIRNPSSVKGELVLHGGTLTLHDHTVQSDNAIATITSRTDLIQAITDTTIAVDSGARQGAEYIMTVRGPVDSPTMNVQRGPGR